MWGGLLESMFIYQTSMTLMQWMLYIGNFSKKTNAQREPQQNQVGLLAVVESKLLAWRGVGELVQILLGTNCSTTRKG